MSEEDLIEEIRNLYDNEEYDKLIERVLSIPKDKLSDEMLGLLAAAYNSTGEYKKAIAVLESRRAFCQNDYMWHYRLGYALYHAAQDDECESDDELRASILERAQTEFARCMNMNPPESLLDECDEFMENIEEELDLVEDEEDEDPDEIGMELYSEEELDVLEEHIKTAFGEFPTVYHEIASPDIHVDICIIPPTEERNYYTLVTMGMGAHIMDIPDNLDKSVDGRAELLICLPRDWHMGEKDDCWFWPIGLLKSLARLPIDCETWLGFAHSVDHNEPFAPNTQFCGSLLIRPQDIEEDMDKCTLPSGDVVNFFEVIPLHRSEMDYKIDNGAEDLLRRMSGVSHITDPSRPNTCEGYVRADDNANLKDLPTDDEIKASADKSRVFADVEWYAAAIDRKNLPVERICAANHIAVFLRWMIAHKHITEEFIETYGDRVKELWPDLRPLVMEELGGALTYGMFSEFGKDFIRYYYNVNDYTTEDAPPPHHFPADVDDIALERFGKERFDSEEFQDEAYLFLPFDDRYYTELSAKIQTAYLGFFREYIKLHAEEQAEYAKKNAELLGFECECCYVFEHRRILDSCDKIVNEGMQPLLLFRASNNHEISTMVEQITNDAVVIIAKVPTQRKNGIIDCLVDKFHIHRKTDEDMAAPGLDKFLKAYGRFPAFVVFEKERTLFMFCTGSEKGRELCAFEGFAPGQDNISLPRAMDSYLDCPNRYYSAGRPAEDTEAEFERLVEKGKENNFVPVIAVISKELLSSYVSLQNAEDPTAKYNFNIDKVKAYRKELLEAELPDGEKVIDKYIDRLYEEKKNKGIDWDEDFVGEMRDGTPQTSLTAHISEDGKHTCDIVVSRFPADRPWIAFTRFPCVKWENAPTAKELMAIAKYWNKMYGAVPATVSTNTLEFRVEKPIGRAAALTLAIEMCAVCPPLAKNTTAGELAGKLAKSTVWKLTEQSE